MKKPILVSGSHRSGTTWTGYVLSKAQHVRYAHEPFNIGLPNRESCPIMHWFQLIDSNDLEYSKKIERYIKSYYSPLSFVNIKNTLFKGKYSSPYYFLADIKGRFTDRTVIKDPIAFFSAEWFYKELKADIVILIRHHAAFIASLKVKNWQFDFNELKKQQNLMDSFPLELQIQIEEFVKSDHNIIDQGILLWNLIHFKIIEYKTNFLDRWYFIKHEDLSKNPINEFKKMCDFLGLKMTNEMLQYIKQTTVNKTQDNINRNSLKNIHTWKERLSAEEISLIRTKTEKYWRSFYNETDWQVC